MRSDAPPTLAFDTSAAHCAAALLWGDGLTQRRVEPMPRGQAERLMPMCAEMLKEAGLRWPDLGTVGVGIGPGNFTGLRIGVAAARGIAFALGQRAVGISTFEALAADHPGCVRVILDARRGGVFVQDLTDGRPDAPACLTTLEALAPPKADTLCLGYAAKETADRFGVRAGPEAEVAEPCVLARLARARQGEQHPPPAPLYLRAADAVPTAARSATRCR